MELETGRLLLREFSQADFAAVHSYASDPEVTRFMDWGPNTESDTRSFLERAVASASDQPRTGFELGIVDSARGVLVGGCGLHESGSGQGMLGYCLHREAWGQGIATEAAAALLRFAFHDRKLHRVWAGTDPENHASSRVLAKLGMRREGHLRENVFVRSGWRDTVLFAMLEREWSQHNERSI